MASQVGIHIGHGHTRFRSRGDADNLCFRVDSQNSQQLYTRVSGSADDAYFNHSYLQRGLDRIGKSGHVV